MAAQPVCDGGDKAESSGDSKFDDSKFDIETKTKTKTFGNIIMEGGASTAAASLLGQTSCKASNPVETRSITRPVESMTTNNHLLVDSTPETPVNVPIDINTAVCDTVLEPDQNLNPDTAPRAMHGHCRSVLSSTTYLEVKGKDAFRSALKIDMSKDDELTSPNNLLIESKPSVNVSNDINKKSAMEGRSCDMQNSKAAKIKTSPALSVGIKKIVSIDIDMKTTESDGTCSMKDWKAAKIQTCFKSAKEKSDPGVLTPKSDKHKVARPLTTLDCEVCDRSVPSDRSTEAAKHEIETKTFDFIMTVDTASASSCVDSASVESISFSPGRETTSSLAHPSGRGKVSGDQMDDAAAAARSGAIEPAATPVRVWSTSSVGRGACFLRAPPTFLSRPRSLDLPISSSILLLSRAMFFSLCYSFSPVSSATFSLCAYTGGLGGTASL